MSKDLFKCVPSKYMVLVDPCRVVGENIGKAIAKGWDHLIDTLFVEDKKA